MITLVSLSKLIDGEDKSPVYVQQNAWRQQKEELLWDNEIIYSIETEGANGLFTGSITHTGNRYIYQITLEKLADGKRKRESKSFKSLEEAEQALEARLDELNNTIPAVPSSI